MKHIPEQRGLFSDIAVSVIEEPKQVRARLAKKAFERSDADWREAYRRFILQYAEIVPEFIAEQCRMAYQQRRDLPRLASSDYRASGEIYKSLVREGKLRATGRYAKSVERSSPMMIYTKF